MRQPRADGWREIKPGGRNAGDKTVVKGGVSKNKEQN